MPPISPRQPLALIRILLLDHYTATNHISQVTYRGDLCPPRLVRDESGMDVENL
jgi:hypothetical protein